MDEENNQKSIFKLAVIGSGVVGQATGKGFISKGYQAVFCDINKHLLEKLQSQGYKTHTPETLEKETDAKAFFLSVSTPTVNGKIKLDFLKTAVINLAKGALRKNKKYCIVVIRSTVPPGTVEKVFVPLLQKYSYKKAGKDFGVCMNPEYLRENKNEQDFKNPWIIVIGQLDKKSGDVLEQLYGNQDCPIFRTSIKEAEMQKYVHNIFNATKISFFNEMRVICDKLKVDADKIFELVIKSAEASWNHAYGIHNFGPYGGSCLPKDTTAFLDFADKALKEKMPLLEAVIKVNETLLKSKFKTDN